MLKPWRPIERVAALANEFTHAAVDFSSVLLKKGDDLILQLLKRCPANTHCI